MCASRSVQDCDAIGCEGGNAQHHAQSIQCSTGSPATNCSTENKGKKKLRASIPTARALFLYSKTEITSLAFCFVCVLVLLNSRATWSTNTRTNIHMERTTSQPAHRKNHLMTQGILSPSAIASAPYMNTPPRTPSLSHLHLLPATLV